MSSRRPARCAFTLVEMLAVTAVSGLLLLALAALVNSSLSTMGHTTRSVRAHDATTQLLEALRDDLADLSPPGSIPAAPLVLRTGPEEVVLAVVRPDTRFHEFARQGYYRHVEYRWERGNATLTRAVYHSANHPAAANLAASPDSADPAANASRLARLTPALAHTPAPAAWLNSDEMQTAREAARETPLVENLADLAIECLTGRPPRPAGTQWADPSSLPAALRVRAGFRPSATQGEPRHFTLLIPLQSTPGP